MGGMMIKSLFTWWNRQTLNTRFYTWRKGVLVGDDAQGNVFYQTRDGKRRWVIFAGECEASRVGADWHGWLHHTFAQPPTKRPLPKQDWEKPHKENQSGTAGAYYPDGSLRKGAGAVAAGYEAWSPNQK